MPASLLAHACWHMRAGTMLRMCCRSRWLCVSLPLICCTWMGIPWCISPYVKDASGFRQLCRS